MGLFRNIFSKKITSSDNPTIIPMAFGRYSDAYRTTEQEAAWDNAVNHFEKENYLVAFEHFFRYLKDQLHENITWQQTEEGLAFEFLQGSKKIVGRAENEHVEIEVKLAKCEELTVAFMRLLMERNYELRYGRFALDKQSDIAMKFDTHFLDASPYKLYNAFREVAIHSDKLDDLLVDEFDNLYPIDNAHIIPISPEEKNIKYKYTRKWITNAFAEMDKLDKKEYSAGIAYLLLALNYKLDYLIKPEGFMMEVLERVHRLYFNGDGKPMSKKCTLLRRELQTIMDRSRMELQKEFYGVVSTFGVTQPASHEQICNIIDGELSNIDWYLKNKFDQLALAITGYIVGYSLFYYAIPKPIKAFMHLYYKIVETDYFQELGEGSKYFNEKNQNLNKSTVKSTINSIVKSYRKIYPNLSVNVNLLNFESLPLFAKSYLIMIREMNIQ